MIINRQLNVSKKILLLITLCITNSAYSLTSNVSDQFNKKIEFHKQCKVHGELRDRQGAVIPESIITFRNLKTERIVKTDYSGKYSIEISEGIYEIKPQLGSDWESYERAKLNIRCENNMTINVYSFPKVISLDNHYDKYKAHSLPNLLIGDERLNIVIVSLNREVNGDDIIFTDAIFNYNNYTVSANKIILNTKERFVIAEGDAWIETGKDRKDSKKLTLKFRENKVIIEQP